VVVRSVDRAGDDDVGAQRGDVADGPGPPDQRRAELAQQLAHLLVGGDQAPDHGRQHHRRSGGVHEGPPSTTGTDEAGEHGATGGEVAGILSSSRWHARSVGRSTP
jgi:hypothetical protein